MVTSDLGSAEDAVRALLEYLVDPLLPSKSSTRRTPSLSQQESVAKQVLFFTFTFIRLYFHFCCFYTLPLNSYLKTSGVHF